MKDHRKILIMLQFWEGDKKQMMRVARFLADIETKMSEEADILFMSRYDCEQDPATVQYVSRKFGVHTARCRRQAEGWPYGCNELFWGSMDWVFEQREAKHISDYKALLLHEADALPTVPGWLKILSDQWDAADTKVLGAFQSQPGPHINGNALYSGEHEFLRRVSRGIGGCSPHGGYDYLLYPEWVRQGCKNSKRMRSFWQTPTLPYEHYEKLVSDGVVFLHGVKDDSVMDCFKRKFMA